MTAPTTSLTPRDLLARWEEQQSAYVAHRENRFEVMLDVLRLHSPAEPTVLDLACGPGSIADRVLARVPGSRVVATDYDPVLARLAGMVLGDRATVIDADLAEPGWSRRFTEWRFDAVLTSTALHWLSPRQLLSVYTELAAILPPGAVLLNADHLRFGPEHPTLAEVSARHDEQVQRVAFTAGTPTWDEWWALAGRLPELAERMPERERRFAGRPPQPLAPPAFHLAALRTAGFAEAGTVWQYLDDYVVFARR
ncbi:SAM-dependent methyltransferase [Nonomuraea thailandensis]|uniref:SAM-dependent methyltransferase n=1 Tax=Nonomuraea thailandensis TaxID=1188745 RepID=A0A9X2GKP2_9ACTN|nr:class I SAM-dependent methyltransferase [Nonomuraea thailandensis]MCP2356328.1 SAM-dependent methyltransferase [Nonomuraea thailandensis]